jgi:hypothetical protein
MDEIRKLARQVHDGAIVEQASGFSPSVLSLFRCFLSLSPSAPLSSDGPLVQRAPPLERDPRLLPRRTRHQSNTHRRDDKAAPREEETAHTLSTDRSSVRTRQRTLVARERRCSEKNLPRQRIPNALVGVIDDLMDRKVHQQITYINICGGS